MSKPERSTRPARPTRTTYERALDMLEARSRGVIELRRLLLRKGEPEPDVDAAIERLQRAGLLDDPTYARQFARSKALGAGQSRRRLQQELAKRGVARAVAEEAIEAVFTDESIDEEAAIERVARKKLRTLSKVDPAVQRGRLYGFLARRGYDADEIARVLRVVLAPEDDVSQ